MASNNFYRNIIFRTCLLALTALLMGWFFFDKNSLIPGIFTALIFVFQVAELIHFLNRTKIGRAHV